MTIAPSVLTHLSLPLTPFKEGKVRVVYDVGTATVPQLLLVTTDRVSAFDVILGEGIPNKGRVLTQLAAYWFSRTTDIVPNHLIATDVADFPETVAPYTAVLTGRSMLVHKTQAIPVECVVRGYLSGSAWTEYQEKGTVAGISLPEGLQQSDRLPAPLFTPAIKNDHGHDENISFATLCTMIGAPLAEKLRDISIRLYTRAYQELWEKDLILADTKFEFGHKDGQLLLIDEALTPDSSRYWDRDQYKPGISPPSYDKQIIRDYLLTLPWDKTPPAPPLSTEIIEKAAACYQLLYKRVVGE